MKSLSFILLGILFATAAQGVQLTVGNQNSLTKKFKSPQNLRPHPKDPA